VHRSATLSNNVTVTMASCLLTVPRLVAEAVAIATQPRLDVEAVTIATQPRCVRRLSVSHPQHACKTSYNENTPERELFSNCTALTVTLG